jgi:hypothetical protein
MIVEWKSERLRSRCRAWRYGPVQDSEGCDEYHLKSIVGATRFAWGHGSSLDEAKENLERNITNLYPQEVECSDPLEHAASA